MEHDGTRLIQVHRDFRHCEINLQCNLQVAILLLRSQKPYNYDMFKYVQVMLSYTLLNKNMYYTFSMVVSQLWGFVFVSGRPESPTEMPVPTDVPSPTTPCDDEGATLSFAKTRRNWVSKQETGMVVRILQFPWTTMKIIDTGMLQLQSSLGGISYLSSLGWCRYCV